MEKNVKPSEEQIDELHQKYITALNQLFEENKGKYGLEEKHHITFI